MDTQTNDDVLKSDFFSRLSKMIPHKQRDTGKFYPIPRNFRMNVLLSMNMDENIFLKCLGTANFARSMENRKLKNSELIRLSPEEFKDSEKTPLIVILDNIRSLNNIGSVFRTSDAFLIEKIYLCGITAQPPHRDIQKTALGATESRSEERRVGNEW